MNTPTACTGNCFQLYRMQHIIVIITILINNQQLCKLINFFTLLVYK